MKHLISLGLAALLSASVTATAFAEKSGEEVYKASCGTCHNTGVSGAPKLDAKDDWQARATERGRDGLIANSVKGFNAMPAKGLCFSCTDTELAAAVDYMLATAGAVDVQAEAAAETSAAGADSSVPDAVKSEAK